MQAVQEEIIAKKQILDEICDLGEKLVHQNNENERVREAVYERINNHQESYDNINTKVFYPFIFPIPLP